MFNNGRFRLMKDFYLYYIRTRTRSSEARLYTLNIIWVCVYMWMYVYGYWLILKSKKLFCCLFLIARCTIIHILYRALTSGYIISSLYSVAMFYWKAADFVEQILLLAHIVYTTVLQVDLFNPEILFK